MIIEYNKNELYRRANVLVEKEEYERAFKIYVKLEEMYPNDWRYSNMIGYCYVHLNQFDEGRQKFYDALKKNGLEPTLYNNIAWAYNEEECFEKAANVLKKITVDYPTDPHIMQNYGNALYGLEEYEQAAEAFQQTLMLNPHFIQCFFSLGLCYYHSGEYEQAQKYFEATLQKGDSSNYDAQFFLSKCYLMNGYYRKHIEIASLLLDIDDEDIEVLIDRAKSFLQLGQIEDAVNDLSFILFLDQNHEEAINLLNYIQKD